MRRWWESPLVLAIAGTLAIHLLLVTLADAMVVLNPPRPDPPPPPKLELVDIQVPPIVKPPPPPPVETQPDVPPTAVHHVAASRQPATHVETPPPPTTPPTPDSGGAPGGTADHLAPSATGVPVAIGKRNTGHVGRGGTGTGTGAGSGAGSADAPMSIATIKTRAMPKGDYSYEQEKAYPAEAKRLGIEGKIRVKLIVDERGEVRSAALLNRLGHGLDELALARANAIKFEPAKDTDDRPVTSVVVWTFDLELPK